MSSQLLKSLPGTQLGRSVAKNGLQARQPIHLFAEVSEETLVVNTANLSDVRTLGGDSLRRNVHSHDLQCSRESAHVAKGAPEIRNQFDTILNLHKIMKSEGLLEALGDFYNSGFFACGSRAVRAVSFSTTLKPSVFLSPHDSMMTDVESDAKDVCKVHYDKGVTRKEFTFHRSGSQTWKFQNTGLIICEVRKMQKILRIASRKHENDLLHSVRTHTYE